MSREFSGCGIWLVLGLVVVGAVGWALYEVNKEIDKVARDFPEAERRFSLPVTKVDVEKVIREGLKEKTGRVPDTISVQPEGDGKYSGTALFGVEMWDVSATVTKSGIEWKGRSRNPAAMIEGEVVEKEVRRQMRERTGQDVRSLTLTKQADGLYKGSGVLNGVRQNITVKVVNTSVEVVPGQPKLPGQQIECEWEPAEK
jgi:hypothetical protein